jgi:SAM-dependent methyltransferase
MSTKGTRPLSPRDAAAASPTKYWLSAKALLITTWAALAAMAAFFAAAVWLYSGARSHGPSLVYDQAFFRQMEADARKGAARMVPEIVRIAHPKSIVDVGSGTGVWAAQFMKTGITDAIGIDGDWVKSDMLKIPPASFLVRDLRYPLSLNRTFDLALCLEVAEHLPPERAEGFIADLVQLAPIVCFSAAIPAQGGADHINERWQSYWAKLFAAHAYVPVDCLRMRFWNDDEIPSYYRQNTILYVSRQTLDARPDLQQIRSQSPSEVLSLVHPRIFEAEHRQRENLWRILDASWCLRAKRLAWRLAGRR